MNQASLYRRASNAQRHDAQAILQEYANIMQWRLDGQDSLIDVGCGSGNVLVDYVYPILPANFQKIIGTDISQKMVAYARKCYGHISRADFQILDIGCESLPFEFSGQYDHVTSFYCLHWVQNQRKALENIYQLLRHDGGDCLLVFLATNPVFDVYKTLSKLQKWCAYMYDVEKFISPLHYSEDPKSEFSQLLYETGFEDYSIEVRNEIFVYEGVERLKDNVKAVCPFLERIPEQQHADFLDDFVNTVVSMKLREDNFLTADYRFISPYKLVVVYARKYNNFRFQNVIDNERNFQPII